MKQTSLAFLLALFFCVATSCTKTETPDDTNNNTNTETYNNSAANIIFKFEFDETQERLNNIGLPAEIPAGHAAQTPNFRSISAHYVELAPLPFTLLGEGAVLYKGEETEIGGEKAIDFDKATLADEGEIFLSVPISSIPTDSYQYLRVSLSYQNYDIQLRALGFDITGTLASFIGYNTYIDDFGIKNDIVSVHANRRQGFWAFETDFSEPLVGEAPAGAVTVPNPLFDSSPIPQGSCVVTGPFEQALAITGEETEDIIITISLSINNSFEWVDNNNNAIFEPLDGEMPVDMGIRGLIPIVEN
ncbi:MAG: hypothetical protein ACPG5B_09500 [Chitinophagales bacterium]